MEFLVVLRRKILRLYTLILVQAAVHRAVVQVGNEAQTHAEHADEDGTRKPPPQGNDGTEAQCQCGSQPGHGHLQTHSESHLLAREPAYDGLGHGDAAHLIADAKEGKPQCGQRHLALDQAQ